MIPIAKRPLAFVDIETTGGHVTRDRVTEVAVICLDGPRITRWSQLINPGLPIPLNIERLTGISDSLLADAPSFEEIAHLLWERLDGHVFVAHNARFDYGFLKNEFRRAGYELKLPQLCTVKLSRELFPEQRQHNLDSLIARYDLRCPNRHRAMGDAEAIFDFWRKLPGLCGLEALEVAIKVQRILPSLPPFLAREAVDRLPKGVGVYLFYGENDLPLYIGKSRHLRQRVLSHFAADHGSSREMNLAQQVRRVEALECAGEVDALLTESRLVKSMQPVFNHRLRREQALCSWQLINQGYDLWQPRLVYARDLAFGRQPDLYGVFKHAAEAREALLAIAKTEGLCPVLLGLEKGKMDRACFAHQLGRCRGACCGKEPVEVHSQRLRAALASLHLEQWPFRGPALLEEGGVFHLIDAWCYLGVVEEGMALWELVSRNPPVFDRDCYRILVNYKDRLEACHPLLLAKPPMTPKLRAMPRAA